MTDTIPAVEPGDLVRYLSSRGWRRRGAWRGAGVWTIERAGDLLIPEERGFDDEADVLREAVRRLARYEQRSELDVALDIVEPLVDSQYFRTQPDTPSGTTPLLTGVRAFNGVADILRYAARSVDEGPKPVYTGQGSRAVREFLEGVRLGVTLPGSYVLTTRVPLDAAGESSWNRQVLVTLYNATQAASFAADRVMSGYESAELFEGQVEAGVSANLCEALSYLGGRKGDRPFEVGFAWAPGRPVDVSQEPVRFNRGTASVLEQAGRHLRQLVYSGEATMSGTIEDLHDDQVSQPRVKVNGDLDVRGESTHRPIWIYLPVSTYRERAADWHLNRVRLRFRGELVLEGGLRLRVSSEEDIEVLGGRTES